MSDQDMTTVQVTRAQKEALDGLKQHDREPYKSVIARLIESHSGGSDSAAMPAPTPELEQLDRIESALQTVEQRTGTIEQMLDEVTKR